MPSSHIFWQHLRPRSTPKYADDTRRPSARHSGATLPMRAGSLFSKTYSQHLTHGTHNITSVVFVFESRCPSLFVRC